MISSYKDFYFSSLSSEENDNEFLVKKSLINIVINEFKMKGCNNLVILYEQRTYIKDKARVGSSIMRYDEIQNLNNDLQFFLIKIHT